MAGSNWAVTNRGTKFLQCRSLSPEPATLWSAEIVRVVHRLDELDVWQHFLCWATLNAVGYEDGTTEILTCDRTILARSELLNQKRVREWRVTFGNVDGRGLVVSVEPLSKDLWIYSNQPLRFEAEEVLSG